MSSPHPYRLRGASYDDLVYTIAGGSDTDTSLASHSEATTVLSVALEIGNAHSFPCRLFVFLAATQVFLVIMVILSG